jgi:hypothetical protein
MKRVGLAAAATIWMTAVTVGGGQSPMAPSAMRDHPAIAYSKTPPEDPVAALGRRLESGETTLEFTPGSGYLKSLLEALQVPVESQILVFSKTSFQAPRINPRNPRAIYFNDSVSVGWVRGGEVLELIGHDPKQGAMFYTLENQPDAPLGVSRNFACVACHTSEATMDVPGMFIGSVFPGPDGTPLYGPAYMTDHRTPFAVRWGGWFATGKHRAERHMGNAVVPAGAELGDLVTPASVHVERLEGRFDPAGYPTLTSDIAALLTIEHQAKMLNLITRLGWDARIGSQTGRSLNAGVEELVDYLLFVDEAPLPGPISGNGFAATFSAQGPRDRNGRSLRQLDLETRLLRYPCSYLIYSDAFDALPAVAKDAVYARLWRVLSGAERHPRFNRLSPDDRQAIVEMLRDTKPDLPSYFTPDPPAHSGP